MNYLFPIKTSRHIDLPPDHHAKPDMKDFIVPIFGVLLVTLLATAFFTKNRPFFKKIIFFYMFLSMIIHFTIELYWTTSNDRIFAGDGWFDKFWRENGKSDTRWISRDEVIFCLEFMAAFFCGPMSFLTILSMIADSPTQYILQAITGTAQAYGLLITWVGEVFVNMQHVPNDPVMIYVYFIGLQLPWVIFPFLMCVDSIKHANNYGYKQKTK